MYLSIRKEDITDVNEGVAECINIAIKFYQLLGDIH
jgi:hypothetical protein